jgi:sugar phosphate isomerase/epimerase
MQNVVVPLNAFDRFKVLEEGQEAFIESIAQSGAFGVEIRRELLSSHYQELGKIRTAISKYGLFTIYSAPIELWDQNHDVNQTDLNIVMQEAVELGAKWVKVSLGHYKEAASNVRELSPILKRYQNIQLLVENDQTFYGGNISHLSSFFESAAEHQIPIKMTFDSGNWQYSGQDFETALQQLGPYVMYLHLKQVDEGLNTIPIQKDGNHSWKKAIRTFPSDMLKALEFPIEPIEKAKEYIHLITELEAEREAILCDS